MKVDTSTQLSYFRLASRISTLVTALSWLGIAFVAPVYIKWFNLLIKLYVSTFLVIRFNPWVTITTGEKTLDRTVGFQAGVLLMYTAIMTLVPGLTNTFEI